MKYLLMISVLGLVAFGLISSMPVAESFDSGEITGHQFQSDTLWIAPEEANALVNPIEADDEDLAEAKTLYRKHCRSCHGKLGDGKGSGAAELETMPTDFATAEFLNQSDGSMFWKIAEGKDEMKPYNKKMSEEEIWLTVIYIKAFATTE